MNFDGEGHDRPNDRRDFIHKTILGIGGSILRTAGGIGGAIGLPGAGFVTNIGNIIGGGRDKFGPGGGRGPFRTPFQQPVRLPGIPESDPMDKNRQVGITPQDTARGALQNGCPVSCPPAKGNRRVNAAGQCAPPGFHWNVSDYHRKGGPCSSFAPGFVEAGTVLVKNRRLNPSNGPAENKAIKRLEAGQDHAKKILRATGWRTISKKSSREMQLRPRRSRH